jgi:hypothetical protein
LSAIAFFGGESLISLPQGGRYRYPWAFAEGLIRTCRQLVVALNDGTVHRANVRFEQIDARRHALMASRRRSSGPPATSPGSVLARRLPAGWHSRLAEARPPESRKLPRRRRPSRWP